MEGANLRVHLETGDVKAVKYAANTTVQDIINIMGLKIGLQSVAHFGLYLEHSDAAQSQWLSPLRPVATVEAFYQSKTQIFVTSSWKYTFRVRFLPKNAVNLYSKDKTVFSYLHQQLCRFLKQGKFDDIAEQSLVQLAGAEIVRRCLGMASHKVNLDYFEKEIGFSEILSEGILHRYKVKELKKLLSPHCKEYEKLSEDECKLVFFKTLQEHSELGLTTFKVQLEMMSGWGVGVEFLIGPRSGISRKEGDKITPVAEYSQLRSVGIVPQGNKAKVEIRLIGYDTEVLKIICESIIAAEELASLLDGYYKLFVDARSSILASEQQANSRFARAGRGSPGTSRASLYLPDRPSMMSDPSRDVGSRSDDEDVDDAELDHALQQQTSLANVLRRASEMNLQGVSRTRSDAPLHQKLSGSSRALHGSQGNLAGSKPALPPMRITPGPSSGPTSPVNTVAPDEELDDYMTLDDKLDCDTIFRDQLTIARVIGEGQFGSVNEGVWTRPDNTNVPVAIKTCKNNVSREVQREFLAEATLMSKLNHPHIVRILGVSLSSPILIVCELVPLGSLRNYLLDNKPSLNLKMLLGYNWQIVSAMSYLEHVKVIHRDLATRNILVATRQVVKLTDFGLSRVLTEDDIYTATGGKMPVKWMAPESINYRTFTTATDVWSFGVCMWEIMSYGEKPYPQLQNSDVIDHLESGARLQCPDDCPDSLYRVMHDCWAYKPEDRPSFRELYDRMMQVIAEERIEIQGVTTSHLRKSTSEAEMRAQTKRIVESVRGSQSSIAMSSLTAPASDSGRSKSPRASRLTHQQSLPASAFASMGDEPHVLTPGVVPTAPKPVIPGVTTISRTSLTSSTSSLNASGAMDSTSSLNATSAARTNSKPPTVPVSSRPTTAPHGKSSTSTPGPAASAASASESRSSRPLPERSTSVDGDVALDVAAEDLPPPPAPLKTSPRPVRPVSTLTPPSIPAPAPPGAFKPPSATPAAPGTFKPPSIPAPAPPGSAVHKPPSGPESPAAGSAPSPLAARLQARLSEGGSNPAHAPGRLSVLLTDLDEDVQSVRLEKEREQATQAQAASKTKLERRTSDFTMMLRQAIDELPDMDGDDEDEDDDDDEEAVNEQVTAALKPPTRAQKSTSMEQLEAIAAPLTAPHAFVVPESPRMSDAQVKRQAHEILSELDDLLDEEDIKTAQVRLDALKTMYQDKVVAVMKSVMDLKESVRLNETSAFVDMVRVIVMCAGEVMDMVDPVMACLADLNDSQVAPEVHIALADDVSLLKVDIEKLVERTGQATQFSPQAHLFQAEMLDAAFKLAVDAKKLCDRITKF
ncbi:ephrin type-A receptor 4a [Capsaspora owczarzaki ATCC 30864]|uniref:TKL protein kinase n=1 Tax=Capsaspora owczarzaki (strain ATCC 30864) TaxID=595528 RepID=A0A0D2X4P5_CAPO3|nr:ephrin type-A receptor 4a [Capsaspora owczarzaki ATCC 30864]KJE96419.1 TKL protein kinase [Capsaspora owczarzaki ATCC 30864]|eukprot:XP_004344371.2 ephrin type-A receptor 4a [Capsaspora owczarzaki ATCC 30864]